MKSIDPVVLKVMGLTILIALVFIGISIGAKTYGITLAPWWFVVIVSVAPMVSVFSIILCAYFIDDELVVNKND